MDSLNVTDKEKRKKVHWSQIVDVLMCRISHNIDLPHHSIITINEFCKYIDYVCNVKRRLSIVLEIADVN